MVHISLWFLVMKFVYWAEAYLLQGKAGALVVASKEIVLELNADKPRHIIMSQDKNAG